MKFILDNNVFSDTLKNIPFSSFLDVVYKPFQELIDENIVISVDEIYRELEAYFGKRAEEYSWLKRNKKAFKDLTDEDCGNLMKILENKKFRESIKESSIRSGTPEADAMIVAKAITVNGIVVTNESNSKRNSDKVPNMCVEYNIKYIMKNDFYKVLRNKAAEIDLLEGVTVYKTLDLI